MTISIILIGSPTDLVSPTSTVLKIKKITTNMSTTRASNWVKGCVAYQALVREGDSCRNPVPLLTTQFC